MESNYSKLIVPPKFSATNVKQNLYDVGEYGKILKGTKSKKMAKVSKNAFPFGRIYATNTGDTCIDIKSNKSKPRYTVINAKSDSKGKGLLESANADFNNSATSNIYEFVNKKNSNKCMSVTVKEINERGKSKLNTKFVSLAEIEKMPKHLFKKGKKPSIPKKYQEGFSGEIYQEGFSGEIPTVANFMDHMDAGQKFFIGTLAVMGLYMYHELLKT